MQRRLYVVTSALVVGLAGCSSTPPAAPPAPVAPAAVQSVPTVQRAEAALASASGSLVSGRVVLLPAVQGVRITGTVGGLRAAAHAGFHVHERGDCSAVDASSAGGHFNPHGVAHGRAGAANHHLGDMDNLIADGEGVAQVDIILRDAALGGGSPNDILGKAIVVHANADDYHSQPAGNAGARVACGVIRTPH